MIHRGPDSEGTYEDAAVSLGVRRLRVIDLVRGDQPIHNEAGDVWVVFNGEIYNYKELREQLVQRGHKFYTTSDTETIVHLYEEKAEALVDDLRGFFAFALYDMKKQTLILARDRVGKKPLYYYTRHDGGETVLRFASSLRALISADFEVRLNQRAVAHYLTYLYNPLEESMVEGIRRLLPGHMLTFDLKSGEVRGRRFWELNLSAVDSSMSEEAALSLLESSLNEAVKLRLSADVPVGAFLSGGVDSSVVCASLSMMGAKLKTFALGFDSPGSETGFAALVASNLDLDHREFILSPDILRSMPEIVSSLDEPIGDPSIVPTWFLSKKVKEHVTVALTGEGGDENFFGYPWFNGGMNRYFKLPSLIRTPARAVLRTAGVGDVGALEWYERNQYGSLRFEQQVALRFAHFTRGEVSAILGAPCPDTRKVFEDTLVAQSGLPPQRRIARLGFEQQLANDFLAKDDQMSMASSLELRSPMLDFRFVEAVARIPDSYKRGKWLLKKAAVERYLLPKRAIYRKKGGFTIPLSEWSKDLHETVDVPLTVSQHGNDYRSVVRYFGLAVLKLWKQSVLA